MVVLLAGRVDVEGLLSISSNGMAFRCAREAGAGEGERADSLGGSSSASASGAGVAGADEDFLSSFEAGRNSLKD